MDRNTTIGIAAIAVLVISLIAFNFEEITGQQVAGSTPKEPEKLTHHFERLGGISKLVVEVEPPGKPARRYIDLFGPRTKSTLTKCDPALGTKEGKSDCVKEIIEINLATLPSGTYTAKLRDPSSETEVKPIKIRIP